MNEFYRHCLTKSTVTNYLYPGNREKTTQKLTATIKMTNRIKMKKIFCRHIYL